MVLDAGHGGKDPGTLGPNSREKDVTLAVTLKLGEYIQKAFPEVRVVYTRKTDVFVELNRRSEIANQEGADLFISIHCNSAPVTAARGAETFVMGLDVDASNLAVAQRENAVISYEEDYTEKYEGYDPDSPESFMIFSLMRNIFLEQSLDFAGLVQHEFTTRVQRVDRGVKQERFLVLFKSGMPSVLIELGFLTNRAEEQFLLSEEGQAYMASAIFRAFRSYKEQVEQRAASSIVQSNVQREQKAVKQSTKTNGRIYLIQISSVRKPIEQNHPLRKTYPNLIEEKVGDYYRYFAMACPTLKEAKTKLQEVRKNHPDAFIVYKE